MFSIQSESHFLTYKGTFPLVEVSSQSIQMSACPNKRPSTKTFKKASLVQDKHLCSTGIGPGRFWIQSRLVLLSGSILCLGADNIN